MTEFVLLNPPAEVRQACCSGLEQRTIYGRGGTARSVPFASRVCAGGPVTQDDLVAMLTHMAAIEDAMVERGLADPALSVAWLLWGGDDGRAWAEGFVMRERPVVAAPAPAEVEPVEQDPEAPGWILALNRLAVAEVELLARIHELMEAGVEFAVGRLRSKVVNGLTRPSAALKAACGGLGQRDALLAAMANAGGAAAAVQLVPDAILARVAPSIEADESLRQVFVQLSTRLRDLIGAHQELVAVELGNGGVSDVALTEARHLWRGDLDTALVAATDELMGIVARVAREAADVPDDGEIPTGRVPASLAFRLLSGAGGGDPGDGSRQDYVTMGEGEVLAAGVALGVTALRAIHRASLDGALHAAKVAGTLVFTEGPEFAIVTRTTWRWGGSARPFPSHQRLDGASWDDEAGREDVCRNPERFPPVATLHPGDHRGCSCSFTVQLVLKQTKAAKAKFVPNSPTPTVPPPPGPPPTPMTTVAPAASPVIPRRGQRQATVVAKVSPGTKKTAGTVAKAEQAQAMGEALATLTNAPKRKVDIRVHDLRGPNTPLGYAVRGKPSIVINANKGSTTSPGMPTSHFAGNTTKVTDIEATLIHEWGHTVDIDHEKSDAFFAEISKTGAFPSGYAKTSPAELYAESFLDFHVDPETAHPTAKLAAERFGWTVVTPLKDVSALAKRLNKG